MSAQTQSWKVREWDKTKEISFSSKTSVEAHPLLVSIPRTSGNRLKIQVSLHGEVDPLSASLALDADASLDSIVHACDIDKEIVTENADHNAWKDLISALDSLPACDPRLLVVPAQTLPETSLSALCGYDFPNLYSEAKLLGRQRITWRLHQLELIENGKDSSSGGETVTSGGFTPEQFDSWMIAVKNALLATWNADQRSLALKLVIQCVRMLGIANPYEFYGHKFVLIVDVLDTLAELVLERLKNCNDGIETGRNWLRKVGSIRELLPRIYLQAALMPVASLLCQSEREVVERAVCAGVYGVGEGVVASLLRCYASHRLHLLQHSLVSTTREVPRCGRVFSPSSPYSEWFLTSAEQSLEALLWTTSNRVVSPTSSSITSPALLLPCLRYLCCLAASLPAAQNEAYFKRLVSLALRDPQANSEVTTLECLWLQALLGAFRPVLVAGSAQLVLDHARLRINEWESSWTCSLIRALSNSLCSLPSLPVSTLSIWSRMLGVLTHLPVVDFLSAVTACISFVSLHCSEMDMEGALRLVMRKVASESFPPAYDLQVFLLTLLRSASPGLCTSEVVLGLLGLSEQCSRTNTSQLAALVSTVLAVHESAGLTFPPLALQLISMTATIHTSHSVLTTEDERRDVSSLVCLLIHRLKLPDAEQQLQALVRVRAGGFSHHSVIVALVHAVIALMMRANMPTKWQASLSRACTANAYISTASLSCPAQRLKMYLLTACAARSRGCHGQADVCLKSSIRELSTLLSSSSNGSEACPLTDCWAHVPLESVAGSLAGALVVTPDPPSVANSPFYFIRGLLQAVNNAVNASSEPGPRHIRVLCQILCCVGGTCQSTQPFIRGSSCEQELLLCRLPSSVLREHSATLCSHLLNRITALTSAVSNSEEAAACASFVLTAVCAWLQTSDQQAFNEQLSPLFALLQKSKQGRQLSPWFHKCLSSTKL